jgi:hypothetical protein
MLKSVEFKLWTTLENSEKQISTKINSSDGQVMMFAETGVWKRQSVMRFPGSEITDLSWSHTEYDQILVATDVGETECLINVVHDGINQMFIKK